VWEPSQRCKEDSAEGQEEGGPEGELMLQGEALVLVVSGRGKRGPGMRKS